jgi:hypothetical protein
MENAATAAVVIRGRLSPPKKPIEPKSKRSGGIHGLPHVKIPQ